MVAIEDYVARTDGTCGKDRDIIVTFRHEKRDEVISRVLRKAKLVRSISQIVFELTFKDVSFRLYGSGKAIFRSMKGKDELDKILTELLS